VHKYKVHQSGAIQRVSKTCLLYNITGTWL